MTDNGERTALRAGLHFIVPVWGVEYTRCFTELCLPTLLAPGNIPALPFADRHVFQIYTTQADREAIEASPSYRRLVRYIPVAFHQVRVHPQNSDNPYSIQSDCFRLAIRSADAADQAMVFLTPDMIMADGGLRNLAAIADRPNVRAVLGPGVRLVKETAGAALLSRHRRPEDESIAIAPRDLVRLLLTEMHPIAKAHFFNGETDQIFLSNLYWRAGAEGLVARCFHLHPFLVYPRVKNAPFTTTVDGDYIEAACPDLAETYICADSDEFCVCELSAASRTAKLMTRAHPLTEFVKWMAEKTTPRHRTLINTVIRLHTGIRDRALWQRTEQEAQIGVAKLTGLIGGSGAESGAGYVDAAREAVPLYFATALRDQAEARKFVEIALASLVAPANLPSRINKAYCRYAIVATDEAAAILNSAPSYKELREHVRVDVEIRAAATMQATDFPSSFRVEAVAAAKSGRGAAMFVDPDSVFADDNFKSIEKTLLRTSVRALLAPRLRMRGASAAPVLRQRYTIAGILSIRREDLVRLALQHPHAIARAQFGDATGGVDPTTLCWKVGTEGVLMHSLDLYPVVIYPRDGHVAPDCVDLPLFGDLGFGDGEIGLMRDTSSYVQCQISDDDVTVPLLPQRDAVAMGAWAATHASASARRMFANNVKLYASTRLSSHWNAMEAEASAMVADILAAAEAAVPEPRRASPAPGLGAS